MNNCDDISQKEANWIERYARSLSIPQKIEELKFGGSFSIKIGTKHFLDDLTVEVDNENSTP